MNRAILLAVAAASAVSMLSAVVLADDAAPPETTVPTPPRADAPAPTTPPADATAKTGSDPIICKVEPPRLGSRIGGQRKVCRKKSEWREVAERAAGTVEDTQGRARMANPPPT